MFEVGTLVRYGNAGVCRVEEIGPPQSRLLNADKEYYTLLPLFGQGKIYTPVDTSVPMRQLISRQELEELIDALPQLETDSFSGRDTRETAAHYSVCIQNGDCEELLRLMKTLYEKRGRMQQAGRKFGQQDSRCMKQAEHLLYGEFAAVLGIEPQQVEGYIEARLKQTNAGTAPEQA